MLWLPWCDLDNTLCNEHSLKYIWWFWPTHFHVFERDVEIIIFMLGDNCCSLWIIWYKIIASIPDYVIGSSVFQNSKIFTLPFVSQLLLETSLISFMSRMLVLACLHQASKFTLGHWRPETRVPRQWKTLTRKRNVTDKEYACEYRQPLETPGAPNFGHRCADILIGSRWRDPQVLEHILSSALHWADFHFEMFYDILTSKIQCSSV